MRAAWLVAPAVLAFGCQAVLGFEDFEAGSGGSAGAGASGGTGGAGGVGGAAGTSGSSGSGGTAGAPPCADPNAPSGMIGYRISDGQCIWIDPHEVTAADYDDFAAQLGDPSPFITPPCGFKTATGAFVAGCATDASSADPQGPRTCVDWCDARAYCLSKGKTLCGDPGTPNLSWWEDICSENGANTYGYPGAYDKNTCNGGDNSAHGCLLGGPCELVSPGSSPGCVTAGGVYDMSGNAAEWVDECDGYTDGTDTCRLRGGSVATDSTSLQCATTTSPARSTRNQHVGFRCCWRPS